MYMSFEENVMRKKGWTQEEIAQAQAILAKHKEDPKSKFFVNFTLGIVLFMVILFSIIAFFVVKPLLVLPQKGIVLGLIILLGAVIGVMVGYSVKDLEIIQEKKTTIVSYGFPLLTAGIGIFLIRTLQRTATVFATTTQYNAIFIGLLYGIMALVPFKIFTWKKKKRKQNESL